MQLAVGHRHPVRLVGVGVDLVADEEIVERRLQHERLRRRQDALRPERCRLQQFVHRAPRGVVADAHRGVQDQPFLARTRRVVDHVARQHHGVRDRDLLVLDRAHADDEQRVLDDVTDGVADLHALARPERAHVGEHDACHDVRHGRRRAERDEHAQKEPDALEGLRLRAGEVRIGRHCRQRQNQEARDLVGRVGPLGMEPPDPDRAALDRIEEQPRQANHPTRDQDDEREIEEFRQVPPDGEQDGADRPPAERQHPFGKTASPGEEAEDGLHVDDERHQEQDDPQHPQRPDRRPGKSCRRDQLDLLDADAADDSALPPADALREAREKRAAEPQQEQEDRGRDDGEEQPHGDAIEAASAELLGECSMQPDREVSGDLLACATRGIGVGVGHRRNGLVAHEHVGRPVALDHPDGIQRVRRAGSDVRDALLDGGRALRWGQGADRRADLEQHFAAEGDVDAALDGHSLGDLRAHRNGRGRCDKDHGARGERSTERQAEAHRHKATSRLNRCQCGRRPTH